MGFPPSSRKPGTMADKQGFVGSKPETRNLKLETQKKRSTFMRYAVISDVHSNLEALTAVLDYLVANPVDKIICCGDIVGYGPSPKECIQKLKSVKNITCTFGNHDAAVTSRMNYINFNKDAKDSIEINRGLLAADDFAFLNSLKEQLSGEDALFLHGSPRDPLNEYLFLAEKFEENMPLFKQKICFVGHTHQPLLFEWASPGNSGFYQSGDIYNLEPDKRYIVNVGSVGQPRDNNPMACICFFDSKYMTASMKRVPYDVKKTREKMAKLKLSAQLSARLEMGV
jgi:predicted phosphodiesterase